MPFGDISEMYPSTFHCQMAIFFFFFFTFKTWSGTSKEKEREKKVDGWSI